MDYENQNQQYRPKPDNNLILAIFCTACCCLPCGIYAIIKANEVNNMYHMGQYDLAEKSAAEAKKWSFIGIGIGAFLVILYILFYFFIFAIAAAS
jgi:hypothetical protein